MKNPKLSAVCLAAALLGGCNSDLRDEVRSALGPREAPRTQVFQADQKAAYDAVKAAVGQMNFTFVRGRAGYGGTRGDERRGERR